MAKKVTTLTRYYYDANGRLDYTIAEAEEGNAGQGPRPVDPNPPPINPPVDPDKDKAK